MDHREGIALVATGAPLAARAVELAEALTDRGHPTRVCPTTSAREWTGSIPQPYRPPVGRWWPHAVIVCPATFHTINAVAAGLNDTAALMLINDAIGSGRPVLFVPTTADRLGRHPAWARSVAALTDAGAAWLDPVTGARRVVTVASGHADEITASFGVQWLIEWLNEHHG